MSDAQTQIDGNAAYDLIEKGSYGKGLMAFVSQDGDVVWKTTAYYAVAQNVEIEEVHLLVTPSSQPAGTDMAELVRQSKLAVWIDTGKGDDNIVTIYGDATVVDDLSKQQDLLREFVHTLPDAEVQALSAESALPEGAYVLRLTPSLLKLRKDATDQPALVSAYEAASR